jgi:hypothetical protein
VIEWRLRSEDVARIRIAFSPLMKLVFSVVALRAPGEHSTCPGCGQPGPWSPIST